MISYAQEAGSKIMSRFNISMMMGSMAVAGMLAAATPAQAQDPLDALGAAAGVAAGVAGGYAWGGHNYCWYPGGWRGPGWYWCGYGARRGYGWGGGAGWHGWRHGGHGHGGHGGGGHGGGGHGHH
jgi:hypothetical protein